MTYPCIPRWMKPRESDPFDYPLRTKKEICFEQFLQPPLFTINVTKDTYHAVTETSTFNVHKADNRNNRITLEANLNEMMLTPLQQKRLIFLLGPRYKNDGKVKIVSHQYTNLEHNLARGFDIFKQLYWEAKRAPAFIWNKMNNQQRNNLLNRLFGKQNPEKYDQLFEEWNKKNMKDFEQFEKIYDNGEYTPKFILDNVQKILDKSTKTPTEDELKEKEKEISNAERKAEEILARENIEKNLVKKQILSKKAYETFFKNDEQKI
jgi:hypothetical protein